MDAALIRIVSDKGEPAETQAKGRVSQPPIAAFYWS
jgi:hypothetical protein